MDVGPASEHALETSIFLRKLHNAVTLRSPGFCKITLSAQGTFYYQNDGPIGPPFPRKPAGPFGVITFIYIHVPFRTVPFPWLFVFLFLAPD